MRCACVFTAENSASRDEIHDSSEESNPPEIVCKNRLLPKISSHLSLIPVKHKKQHCFHSVSTEADAMFKLMVYIEYFN